MDIFSSENWLSEVVLDDEEYNIFDQCQMDNYYLDDFITQDMETAIGGGNFIKQSLSRESFERPAKQLKANSWNSGGAYTDHSYSSSSQIISFANTASPPTNNVSHQFSSGNLEDGTVYNQNALISKDCSNENQNNAPKPSQGTLSNRTPSHAQGHIMAERKRREKLSQRFIALSAIIPGLKKMDKASVLGDAIKYLKQLQERVNLLEEQTKKRTVESVVFVNKSQVTASVDEDASSSDENPADVLSNEALPEIEARVSEKNVLIRIHCEKNKEVVPKVLSEIEKLHLTVVNSSALPFGNHAMDITVAAQMENEFCMLVKDLVKNLRLALLKFK